MKYMFAADETLLPVVNGQRVCSDETCMRIEGAHNFDLSSMPNDGLDNIFDNVLPDAYPEVKIYGTDQVVAEKDTPTGRGTKVTAVWAIFYLMQQLQAQG